MEQLIEKSIRQDLAKAFRDEKITEVELSAYLVYFSALEQESDLLESSIRTFHTETGFFAGTMSAIRQIGIYSDDQDKIHALENMIQHA